MIKGIDINTSSSKYKTLHIAREVFVPFFIYKVNNPGHGISPTNWIQQSNAIKYN